MAGDTTTGTGGAGAWERALKVLRSEGAPLFAVVDAARDVQVLKLLQRSGQQYQSLYEGPEGQELASVAPYLVSLPRTSDLVEHLVQRGWGRSWGCFLTSHSPFKDTRRQLRKFLEVQDDTTGKQLYFRYYDPRVLRVFLPACTVEQRAEFFGPLGCFLVEDEKGGMLRFTMAR